MGSLTTIIKSSLFICDFYFWETSSLMKCDWELNIHRSVIKLFCASPAVSFVLLMSCDNWDLHFSALHHFTLGSSKMDSKEPKG